MPAAQKKRVLLVDDAVVVRSALSIAIAQDRNLEVAGTAANGRLALAKFPSLKPDIVLLDIEMPDMDGLETVRALRKIDSRVPIIMFSSLTERGASVTLEALSLGATDYVAKPSNVDMQATLKAISRELIPKIRALCHLPYAQAGSQPTAKPAAPSPALTVPARPQLLAPVQLVAIGASTGGLGPDFALLAAELQRAAGYRATHAAHFYLAPGDAPFGKVAAAGAGMCLRRSPRRGSRRHCSWRFSHGGP